MITANQLVAHAVGDYLLQSHWMANQKTSKHLPAVVHALTYLLPFLLITQSPAALVVISGTHFIIDRWRLARHVVWLKNQLAPVRSSWAESKGTGYPADTPPWLAVWLMIIADNTIHVIINGLAIRYL